ncbi:MAG: DUF192 domain-containing protein [Candidatus Pacearchaeota archaeon]|jgi:hypothetical protein
MLNATQLVVLIAVIVIIVGSVLLFRPNLLEPTNPIPINVNKVCLKQTCFDVEMAKTPMERERGLMFRKNLSENSGMVFVFENEDKYGIWMKNMQIPIDIIWIGKDKKVVYVKENAQPCKNTFCEVYVPNTEALYVLELKAGTISERGIGGGDAVGFFG